MKLFMAIPDRINYTIIPKEAVSVTFDTVSCAHLAQTLAASPLIQGLHPRWDPPPDYGDFILPPAAMRKT